MLSTTKRLRELDFLRGLAIILVLFRHQYLFDFTMTMGWIGVDLFFVLSGFLVSGLLFKEYLKHGNIQPGRFLIRRGFKIYPLYYLSFLLYLVPLLYFEEVDMRALLSELALVQNYVHGLGYVNPVSWSLAVEEHFYIGLALLLWFGLKHKLISLKKELNNKRDLLPALIIGMMVLSLCFRLASHFLIPADYVKITAIIRENYRSFTMTHLRIDSLLAGVLLSYCYYFKFEWLGKAYADYKLPLLAAAILGVCWTPFVAPESSVFVQTIGFTLLYISFAILLLAFLFTRNINSKLDAFFSKPLVDGISKIGFCSYAIYIIHWLVNYTIHFINGYFQLHGSHYLIYALTTTLSFTIGILMTYQIESPLLRFRDKYVPNRALKLSEDKVVAPALSA